MRWSLQSRPHHRSKSNWESYRLFPTAYPRHPCPPSLSGPLPDPVVSSWRAVAPSSSLPPTQNTPGHSHPRPSHPQTAAKKKKLQDSHPLAPPRLQPHPSPPLIIHSYSRALRHPSATIVTSVLLYAALPNRRLSRACLLPPASNLASPFIRLFFFACVCLRSTTAPLVQLDAEALEISISSEAETNPLQDQGTKPSTTSALHICKSVAPPFAARIPGFRHHALQHSTEIAVPVLARHTRPRLQRSPRRKPSPRPPREQQQQQQHPHIFANINGVPKRRPPSNEEAQTPAHRRHGRFRACAEEAGGGGQVRQHPATITTHQEAVRQGRGLRRRCRAQTD